MHITFKKVNFNNMKSVLVAVLFEAAAARAVRNVQCVCVCWIQIISLYLSPVVLLSAEPDVMKLSTGCGSLFSRASCAVAELWIE